MKWCKQLCLQVTPEEFIETQTSNNLFGKNLGDAALEILFVLENTKTKIPKEFTIYSIYNKNLVLNSDRSFI